MIKTPLSTVIGGAFWTPGCTVMGGQKNLTQLIKSLFSLGEQGFAYDPNDLTTLYQDAAGTIPVTAAGQPVGLMKDKSGRNNHAFQTVSASRPILQQTPILGNELITNGDFSNGTTGWSGNAATLTVSDGKLCVTSTGAGATACYSIPTAVGKTYILSLELIRGTTPNSNQLRVGSTGGNSDVLNINIGTASATKTVQFVAVSAITYLSIGYGESEAGQTSYWDNVTVKEVTGYRTDQNYLAFDGADDSLQTNSINFTATDKVSLFAGVRKLSDATTQMIVESSTGNSVVGVFGILKGGGSTDYFQTLMRGSASWAYATATNQIYAAPKSVILTARFNMAGSPKQELKINNVLAVSSTVVVGNTNFANQPIYIGRRGSSSLPFNGHIYGLIGIGKLTTDTETTAIEKELAKRIGVTLDV